MVEIGFDGNILDFIETKNEYIKLFCLLGNIQKIPISKKKIDDVNMFEKYDYKKMIVNERYLEVKRSRYNKNDSVLIDSELRKRNIFGNESAKKETDVIEAKIHAIKINGEDFEKKLQKLTRKKDISMMRWIGFTTLKVNIWIKNTKLTEYGLLKQKLHITSKRTMKKSMNTTIIRQLIIVLASSNKS